MSRLNKIVHFQFKHLKQSVFRLFLSICMMGTGFLSPEVLPAKEKKDKPVNLLRVSGVKVAETTLPANRKKEIKAIRDGRVSSVATLPASQESPLEIVFSFNNKIVSPEKLILTSPDQSKNENPIYRIDLLISEFSATSGFRKLRTEYPDPKKKTHQFTLPPAGAKWVLLRISPMPKKETVSIAEIELSGYLGAPVSRYEFNQSPANSLQVLKKLKDSESITISKDEEDLVTDASDGKLDDWSFEEAALLASGVTNRNKRKKYLKQIIRFEKEFRSSLKNNLSSRQKGEKLLEWLHKGPLSKGYVSRQTDLSVILDTNTYNCVSSAALYNILGKKLGLDVRAIEVPDHAFVILYQGNQSYDIETTTPYGFNPSRDKAAQKQFEKQTGFRYIPDRHRDQRREINEPGLVAIIYYNHGVELGKQKKHHQALLAYFKALSLDPEFDSAVKNVLATLANWGLELSKSGRFEQAINTVATGLLLAPKDATLLNNRTAIWSQWAKSEMDAGNDSKALDILKRADQAVPDANFLEMQSWVYIRKGENRVKQNQWDLALSDIEEGFSKMDPEPRKELKHWKTNFYLRWANHTMKKKDFSKSKSIILEGLKWEPGEKRYTNNLGYLVQEWIQHVYKNDGLEKTESLISKIQQDLSGNQEVQEAVGSFYIRTVNQLRREEQFEKALIIANKCDKFIKDPETKIKLVHSTYDSWSRNFQKKNQWEKALGVYETALKNLPEDKHLKNNYLAAWASWARSYRKNKEWEKEIQVYETASKKIPGEKQFSRNVGYLIQEWGKDIYKNKGVESSITFMKKMNNQYQDNKAVSDGINVIANRIVEDLAKKSNYEQAEKAALEMSELLTNKDDKARLGYILYDDWARQFIKKKEWKKATDVYSKAMKSYPKDSHFIQNSTATWNNWAHGHIKAKEWKEAIQVYQSALKIFPDESVFKNNLNYCQSKLKK
jgi:tetratricopeptide (TPR) repeat protein